MTLNEIEQDIYRRLNKATTPDTATQTRIRAFVNQRHRELLTLPDCQQLRDDVTTFDTVANTYRYALPQAVARVHRMWIGATEFPLSEQSLTWYRTVATDPTVQTGDPEVFVTLGQTRVAVQPSNASAIYAKSTSAADTTQTLRIEGTITGGYRQSASVTLTGTTAVQIGSLSTWTEIDTVYLSAAGAGTITIHEDSGSGTELARISIGQTMPRYWTVYLWPTPSAARTVSIDYAREITDMSNSTDEPLLPVDFHRLLVYGACMDESLKLDDQRYGVFEREWQKGRDALMYWLHARSSWRPGDRGTRAGNNLGAAFPVGRW